MVFICIYLGLIQSLKVEGLMKVNASNPKKSQRLGGDNTPDCCYSRQPKKLKVATRTNDSKRLNLPSLIPEERKK
jgi:hypothetical protein